MKVRHYLDVDADVVAPGVLKRVAVGAADGAPTFAMRVFEISPGGSTPYHTHPWEHVVFGLSGRGVARSRDGDTPIKAGSAVFVEPDEEHCFVNTGRSLLRMICVVPVEND